MTGLRGTRRNPKLLWKGAHYYDFQSNLCLPDEGANRFRVSSSTCHHARLPANANGAQNSKPNAAYGLRPCWYLQYPLQLPCKASCIHHRSDSDHSTRLWLPAVRRSDSFFIICLHMHQFPVHLPSPKSNRAIFEFSNANTIPLYYFVTLFPSYIHHHASCRNTSSRVQGEQLIAICKS